MSAPKGNQFWLARSSHGRKPKFKDSEQLWSGCLEYFQWVEDNPLKEQKATQFQGEFIYGEVSKMRAMTLGGLCLFLDISQETWGTYREKEDLLDVTRQADETIRNQKFVGASADLLNANIIARDLGLSDKQEVDHKSKDGSMSPALDTSKLSTEAIKQLLAARETTSD